MDLVFLYSVIVAISDIHNGTPKQGKPLSLKVQLF
jgi:hypothetical protein